MTAAEILARVPGVAVLVVGDVCLDRWCTYDPAQADVSRETGLPRIGVVATEATPGAAGTVCNNLRAMGVGPVAAMSVAGGDGFGFELRQALDARQVSHEHVIEQPGWTTFTYTKLLNCVTGSEDLPRVDFINTRPLPAEAQRALIDRLPGAVEAAGAVLVSDQAETDEGGVVTAAVRDTLADLALAYPGKPFVVDSRRRIEHFRHMILKPNRDEADTACLRVGGGYRELRQHTRAPLLAVTRGADGVLLIDERGERLIPAPAVAAVVDICGAGDSFAAGMGAALAAGATPDEAVRFGHLVASVTITKKGTGVATPEEILHADARY
ncbi:MAG: ribokinase [Bryobacterales bacterium]|nr:ribokinase [Bryobacterales bacterium]